MMMMTSVTVMTVVFYCDFLVRDPGVLHCRGHHFWGHYSDSVLYSVYNDLGRVAPPILNLSSP